MSLALVSVLEKYEGGRLKFRGHPKHGRDTTTVFTPQSSGWKLCRPLNK